MSALILTLQAVLLVLAGWWVLNHGSGDKTITGWLLVAGAVVFARAVYIAWRTPRGSVLGHRYDKQEQQ